MRKMSSVCDYFIIASGTSTTHVGAIADSVEKKMKDEGQRLWHIEGAREASWILLDFSDVVAHIFLKDTRAYYGLERLWKDAPQSRFKEAKPAARLGAKGRTSVRRKKAAKAAPRRKHIRTKKKKKS